MWPVAYLEEEVESSPECQYQMDRLKVTVGKIGGHLQRNAKKHHHIFAHYGIARLILKH